MIRTYSELCEIADYEERFKYLNLNGEVGKDTFGFDRYLNQAFYKSAEWDNVRNKVVLRDNGNDMGLEGHPISGRIYVHHMNPLKKEDIINSTDYLFNPEYLISVSHRTHNAIHYGSGLEVFKEIERKPGDTKLW